MQSNYVFIFKRYEVSELQTYLPSKWDYVLFIKLHKLQASLYCQYVDCIKETTMTTSKNNLFLHYNQLRLIWTHPALLGKGQVRTCIFECRNLINP